VARTNSKTHDNNGHTCPRITLLLPLARSLHLLGLHTYNTTSCKAWASFWHHPLCLHYPVQRKATP
jgi:hypothetical protein